MMSYEVLKTNAQSPSHIKHAYKIYIHDLN